MANIIKIINKKMQKNSYFQNKIKFKYTKKEKKMINNNTHD